MSRADASGISGRSKPTISDSAKFSKIRTVSAEDFYATGSNRGTSGFIVETAGNSVITPTRGDAINASGVIAKDLFEIGVQRVSGSGTVHLVY